MFACVLCVANRAQAQAAGLSALQGRFVAIAPTGKIGAKQMLSNDGILSSIETFTLGDGLFTSVPLKRVKIPIYGGGTGVFPP